LFISHLWLDYRGALKKFGFTACPTLGAEYFNFECNLFALADEFDKANKKNFSDLFNNINAWFGLYRKMDVNIQKMIKLNNKIKKLDASRLSDEAISNWIKIFQEAQTSVMAPRAPMWFLETPDNILSSYLISYLEENAKDYKTKIDPAKAYSILSTADRKSLWEKERAALAKIASIKDKKLRNRKLLSHVNKYEWLEYGLQGKLLNFEYFKRELDKIVKRGPENVIARLISERDVLRKNQKEVLKQYKVGNQHRKILKIIQLSSFCALLGKQAQYHGYYCLEKIFNEITKRSGLSVEQIRYLAPDDFSALLNNKKDFKKITAERIKYSIYLSNGKKKIFAYGSKAKKIMEKIKFSKQKGEIEKTENLKGQVAFGGKIKGRVKIINSVKEMVKIHSGNILVSHMTNPEIVTAMKIAAAIVTDIGGITSHAAILARELKKPCIIGTKIATKVLHDGDLVEVNANEGVVRILK